MSDALARRGPDGIGAWESGAAVLGHRRLAIFDLSPAGGQPMVTRDGALGVAFNGAVYNFAALRAELERGGASFHSRTDTEVLLHGYRAWGIDELVRRLRGMFAFALWDAEAGRLHLVRDRLGVKPLVYAADGSGGIAFASTVRALRAAGLTREIDPLAMADFLEYGYVDEQRTVYAGCTKLPPATILTWEGGDTRSYRYWAPPRAADGGRAVTRAAFEEAVEETERLLLRAVELRLQADVPLGALLSGGVDSALVCWAVRRLGGDVTAFSVGTPGHAADETALAAATAGEVGIPHQVLAMGELDEGVLDDQVAAWAEPFAAASGLGMLRVSRAVRDVATVLLTGDGGDDVFLGYPRHRSMARIERVAAALPRGALPAWRAVRGRVPARGAFRRGRHLLDYTTGGLGAVLSATPGLPALERLGVLGERLRGVRVDARRLPWSAGSARQLLAEYLEHDREHQFVAEYLTKVDGATMYHALEARSPFLDQEMWEFASALPVGLRLYRGELKAVLRALARRRIGPRVAVQRKRGFTIPVEAAVRGRWRPLLGTLLADSRLAAEGWIDAAAARRVLGAATLPDDVARQLWYIMVGERWLRYEREGRRAHPTPARPSDALAAA